MKRSMLIILSTLISFNIGALILDFKKFGIDWELGLIVAIHYEVSVYAFKCGILGCIVDWIYRNMFPEEFNKSKKSKFSIESFFIDKTTQCSSFENVLSYIPINNWNWYIYEINAIDNGKIPIDLNALNKELDSLVEGYHISWEELKELLTSLVEIKDCLIVALNQKEDYQDVVKDDFVDFLCLIRIKDGNSCEIKLNKSLIEEKSDSDNL